MPLRDHFRPPVSKQASWEALHLQWPMWIVQQLRNQLPAGFVAEPRVHVGAPIIIEGGASLGVRARSGTSGGEPGEAAPTAWTATRPTVSVDTDLPDEYEYEVRIYDVEFGRRLVAAIELASRGTRTARNRGYLSRSSAPR